LSDHIIRPAREDEIPAIGHLIAYSFNQLPQCAYLVPPLDDRLQIMTGFFTLYAEHAYSYGRIDVIDNPSGEGLVGAAVWFDNTSEPVVPEAYDERLKDLSGEYHERFVALDTLLDKHHPHDPHWHLAFLAVHPDHQDHGLGSKLMAHTHEELDKTGTAAYLEATNENNARLYHRRGYVDLDPADILLPDGTAFYRMWRSA
jgi:ribosomal protein S18 acetylase RimI-like enzyme